MPWQRILAALYYPAVLWYMEIHPLLCRKTRNLYFLISFSNVNNIIIGFIISCCSKYSTTVEMWISSPKYQKHVNKIMLVADNFKKMKSNSNLILSLISIFEIKAPILACELFFVIVYGRRVEILKFYRKSRHATRANFL